MSTWKTCSLLILCGFSQSWQVFVCTWWTYHKLLNLFVTHLPSIESIKTLNHANLARSWALYRQWSLAHHYILSQSQSSFSDDRISWQQNAGLFDHLLFRNLRSSAFIPPIDGGALVVQLCSNELFEPLFENRCSNGSCSNWTAFSNPMVSFVLTLPAETNTGKKRELKLFLQSWDLSSIRPKLARTAGCSRTALPTTTAENQTAKNSRSTRWWNRRLSVPPSRDYLKTSRRVPSLQDLALPYVVLIKHLKV